MIWICTTLLWLSVLLGATPAWAESPDTPVPTSLLQQGKQAYRDHDYVTAIEFLLQNLAAERSAEVYYYLGLSYYSLGTYTLAIDAFQAAIELYQKHGGPPPVDLLFSLGLSHYYANHLERAQEYLNEVLSDPRASEALRQVAEEQLLLTFRDQSPDYQQGLEAFQSGDYQAALKAFQEVLNLLPNSLEINYYAGLSAYHLMNYELAGKFLKKVAELDPDSEYGISAAQTLQVIEKLAQNLPPKPFYGSLTLGSFGDSNVNYGDSGQNNLNAADSDVESALQDLGSQVHLNLNYALNSVSNFSYDYLLKLYWGLNDNPERKLNSYDYNLQQHNFSLFHRIPLEDWLELYLNTYGSLQVLAGQPFFVDAGLRPTLTFYESERLITRAYLNLANDTYASLHERDNWNYALGLNQYIYLWNSQTWMRFGYRFQNVLARDNVRSVLQESGGKIYETEFRAASSRSENQLGMAFGFPLWDANLELGTRFDFLNYNQPDVYHLYRYNINPLTGLPLPREELMERAREIYRDDTRLSFYLNLEWPLNEHWKLLAQYNRTTNVSNISPQDIPTLTNRSYLKDELEFGVQYLF